MKGRGCVGFRIVEHTSLRLWRFVPSLHPQLSQLQVRYEMVSRLVDPSLDLTKALDGEKETLSVRACVRGRGGLRARGGGGGGGFSCTLPWPSP
jgi:hypothetical protein